MCNVNMLPHVPQQSLVQGSLSTAAPTKSLNIVYIQASELLHLLLKFMKN